LNSNGLGGGFRPRHLSRSTTSLEIHAAFCQNFQQWTLRLSTKLPILKQLQLVAASVTVPDCEGTTAEAGGAS